MVNTLPVQKNLTALRLVDFTYLVLFFLQLSGNMRYKWSKTVINNYIDIIENMTKEEYIISR